MSDRAPRASLWGGLVPPDLPSNPQDAEQQFKEALEPTGGADAAPPRAEPRQPAEVAVDYAEQCRNTLKTLLNWEEARETPARLRTLLFDGTGPPAVFEHSDKVGGLSRSFGIINPTAVRIYVGVGGEKAAAGQGAVEVPKKKLLILPVGVGHLRIGADATDLGAGTAIIQLLRFQTIQRAFVGDL